MGTRIKTSLLKCGRCGKPYTNPLTHVCMTRIGRRPQRTRIRPRVTRDCPRCKRPVTNPLTHVCKTRTDFRKRLAADKRRKAAEKKRQAAKRRKATRAKRARSRPAQPQHNHQTCQDADCPRRACIAYKEGVEWGIANCPLPHGGGP